MPDEPQRRVLRTTEELEGFAPQWAELWRRDAGATPFQSPEWLLPWWHQFGQPDLRAVVLERSGRAVGFLPFYVYREPESGARQLLPVGVATTDYLDGVFAPECTVADVRAGIDALREEGGWEEMTVAQLRPGSKLGAALAGVEGVRRFAGESCWRRAAVRIAELPPKIRRNATYYRIRALREGTLELTLAGEAECEAAFATMQRLHTQRWEQQGESGVLADPRVLACHREALPLLARAGMLRMLCLRLNGEEIGVLYTVVDPVGRAVSEGRTQYFYLNAYSTEHAELSPGTVMLALAIEQAATEGVQTIDMLRGEESYKTMWHTVQFATEGFALSC